MSRSSHRRSPYILISEQPNTSRSHQAVLKSRVKGELKDEVATSGAKRSFLPLAAMRSRSEGPRNPSQEWLRTALAETKAMLARAQSESVAAAAQRVAERAAARAQLRDLEVVVESHQALLRRRDNEMDVLQREIIELERLCCLSWSAAGRGRAAGTANEAAARKAVSVSLEAATKAAAVARGSCMAAVARTRAEGEAAVAAAVARTRAEGEAAVAAAVARTRAEGETAVAAAVAGARAEALAKRDGLARSVQQHEATLSTLTSQMTDYSVAQRKRRQRIEAYLRAQLVALPVSSTEGRSPSGPGLETVMGMLDPNTEMGKTALVPPMAEPPRTWLLNSWWGESHSTDID